MGTIFRIHGNKSHPSRAIAGFFVARGHYRECRKHKPCRGVFRIWRLQNNIFSTCHEICLRKINLEYENGKQLQVTIIKITESKENKSIHRLDVSGSTGPGGTAAPPASYGSARPMTSRKADYTPGWNLL